MKIYLVATVILVSLTGCLQSMPTLQSLTAPKYSPSEIQAINSIEFINEETLPENKHIEIIGIAKGKYNTSYGSNQEMEREIKIHAYNLKGNAILPYTTVTDYISMTSTTVITGTSQVVAYVEPEKNKILSDFATAEAGGLVSLSAARFAVNYPESAIIAKNIIERGNSSNINSEHIASALNVLAKTKGRDSIDYFFDYIANADKGNSYRAFTAITPYISNQDNEKLIRFMKFHESEQIKIESAKLLIKFGERKIVETYAEQTNNQLLFKLLI